MMDTFLMELMNFAFYAIILVKHVVAMAPVRVVQPIEFRMVHIVSACLNFMSIDQI